MTDEVEADQSLKRREILKRAGIVILGSVVTTGAVESVPLPASAQHVIGFAMLAKTFTSKLPQGVPLSPTALSHFKGKLPVGKTQLASTMGGFAMVAVKAGSSNPFVDPTSKYKDLAKAELKFLGGLPVIAQFVLAGVDSPAKFGFDGQLSRFAGDSLGKATSGSPFIQNSEDDAANQVYYDLYLMVFGT